MSSVPQEHIDLTRVPFIYRITSKLPLAILHAMSSIVWPILFYIVRYRRATVTSNLEQAFPEMTPAERHDISKAFYRGFVDTAFETMKALDMPAREFKKRVTIVNRELLDRATQDRSQSVIITTLHMGNWEWMLHGVALHFNTIIDPVYKPLHSEASERFIQALRNRFGGSSIKMSDAARNIVRHRKQYRLISMVADQAPSGSERALWLPFLNKVTGFYTGPETLARATNTPLLFAFCRRVRRGYYEVTFAELASQPIPRKADGNPITERYRDLVEDAIRTQPEDWLWSNRRFKRSPPEGWDEAGQLSD